MSVGRTEIKETRKRPRGRGPHCTGASGLRNVLPGLSTRVSTIITRSSPGTTAPKRCYSKQRAKGHGPGSPRSCRRYGPHTDCWHGGEAEEAIPEQCVFIEQVAQARNPKLEPSFLKTLTSDTYALVAKDALFLAEHQGVYPGLKQSFPGACQKMFTSHLQQHQKQLRGEKQLRREENGTMLVTSCQVLVSDNMFTCREVEKDFLGSLDFLQHQPTRNGEHPRRRRKSREVSHPGRGHYECSECGKAFTKKVHGAPESSHRRKTF
ncbi:zinc finger protein 549-like [Phacochoerus africanus]|uniref:zinc finger protein 549-like n=1 Tax=Phacochoerus africanus TaxID=41426 RepID=UPI001FD88968|nr:zinc finger protein 549-like [Phacochoerus africanus]